jgi:hypothetical protein
VSGQHGARLLRGDDSVFDGEVGVFAVRDGDTLLGMGGIVRDVGRSAG